MSKLDSKKLFNRQLKKHGFSYEVLPSNLEEWSQFLQRIEKTYAEFNESREISENVLDVSLREMERLQSEFSESNQKKIKEMNDYLTLILFSAELGTWDWDLTNNRVKFDKKWCDIIGLGQHEISHTLEAFKNYVHPDDVERVLNTASDYMSQKTTRYEVRFRMKHKNGHWVDVLAKGKVISFDTDGKPLRFIGTHLDVSDESKLQKEVESQRIKLIRSSKLASLGEMSAGVAHEINNPLTIIIGLLEILYLYKADDEKFDDKIEKMKKASTRIAKIVQGLKRFSRSGESSNIQSHSLKNIVLESMVLTESKSKTNFTPVTFDCDTDPTVRCDEIEIEQVVVNLIQNSIDAVKSANEKWVKLKLYEEDGFVVLRIIDSGKGISSHLEQKIFDPFFTTKIVGEGTGLGLSITKGILDDHKATISVIHDSPNTCFEIRFLKQLSPVPV